MTKQIVAVLFGIMIGLAGLKAAVGASIALVIVALVDLMNTIADCLGERR